MKCFLIGIIKIYQMIPTSTHNMCRFTPTCSEYSITAIKKYGSIKGLWLTFKRLLKCRKNGPFGYDPVK